MIAVELLLDLGPRGVEPVQLPRFFSIQEIASSPRPRRSQATPASS